MFLLPKCAPHLHAARSSSTIVIPLKMLWGFPIMSAVMASFELNKRDVKCRVGLCELEFFYLSGQG